MTLDLGVFYKDVGGFGTSLTAYSLGSYPMALVASPETQKLYPDFVTPDRVMPVPFIINEQNCIFRQIFEQYLREKSTCPILKGIGENGAFLRLKIL